METNNSTPKQLPDVSWANVVTTNLKPPEGIGFESISGMKTNNKTIMCMGGTPFKLGCRLGEFNVDIELVIEEILEQICDIQTCFEIDHRRKILFLKFQDK
ncbi:hypothetical protein AYI69_g8490, partial [Smittium culicis]